MRNMQRSTIRNLFAFSLPNTLGIGGILPGNLNTTKILI